MKWLQRTMRNTYHWLIFIAALIPSNLLAAPFFDVHLHYSENDAKVFTPSQIMQKLDESGVRFAAVTGSPALHVSRLYEKAPDRIVPLLSIYRKNGDKETWTQDTTIPVYVEKQLEKKHWRGIGELHVLAADRYSPVFRAIIHIAARNKLPLMLHADPVVIDLLYDLSPQHPVIWAHGGTFPYPDLIAHYLKRYPDLRVDLSKRDERIAPFGELRDDWYELFVSYPDRFLVGVDTYSTRRWIGFTAANQAIKHWLKQLPDDVAQPLAYENAAKFFSVEE